MVAWRRLIGERIKLEQEPHPPEELVQLLAAFEPDKPWEPEAWRVVRYEIDGGRLLVYQRMRLWCGRDVFITGDGPSGWLPGHDRRYVDEIIERGITGVLDGRPLSIVRRGRRPWIVGASRLVVRGSGGAWECRTRRLVDVEIQRQNGPAVGRAQTHLDLTPIATPLERTLGLLLLHGSWLDTVRGFVSNFTAGNPNRAYAADDVIKGFAESDSTVPTDS